MTKGSGSAASQPSSTALLAAAYDSGAIDRATWLRYRAYAMFNVDALPAQYRGAAPAVADSALMAELNLGDPLPGEERAEVMSYVGRPASPGSVLYGRGPVQAAARVAPAGQPLLMDATTCDADRWASDISEKHPVRVWMRCFGQYQTSISTVIFFMNELWSHETELMGDPLPDAVPNADPASYGGDDRLDVYIVPRDMTITSRDGVSHHFGGLATSSIGVAAAPFDGNRSSGYILLDQGVLSNLTASVVAVAQAFFQILEDARNYRAQYDRVRFHMEQNWFAPASAEWAALLTVAENGFTYKEPLDVTPAIQFLKSTMPLDARGEVGTAAFDHETAAFLWLLFMQQEGGTSVIKAAWSSDMMKNATDGAGAMVAFDQAFSFPDHFGTFALRNLNDPDLKPALGKLYFNLVGTLIPFTPQSATPAVPPRTGSLFVQLSPGGTPKITPLTLTIDHLSVQYYDVIFAGDVDQVSWDIGPLIANQHFQANLILLPLSANPVPRLISLASPGTPAKLCDVTKLEGAILVVSNGDLTTPFSGTIQAQGSGDACTGAISPPPVAAPITCPGSVIGWPLIKGEYVSGPGNGGQGYQCSYRTPPVSGKGVPSGGIAYMTFDWSTSQQRLYVGEGCGAFAAGGPPYHIESTTRQASADWHVDISQLPYGEEHALDQQAVQAAYGDMQALLPAIEALGGPCPSS